MVTAHRTRKDPQCVAIGGASGFWGDSSVGPVQLVASGRLDYLVFDYLAELTMSLLTAARLKNPEAGYAQDFVTVAMRQVLAAARAQGIRIVSNAGGVNPRACAAALQSLAQEMGLSLRIAVVEGDDLMPQWTALQTTGLTDLQTGQPVPPKLLSANAYLGALPIKAALDAGADVVITGRCVDSAVTLGVLMHEFGWTARDHDLLAAGSLAGHIIECGCQATGGLHTDWRDVPDWAHMGYPIIECQANGVFSVSKPAGTGGLVTPAVVAEQMLYEIGDPCAYILPDVVCDFSQVRMQAQGDNVVEVSGARGRAPTPYYKVSATYADGYRASGQLTIVGFEAEHKARRTGEAILERTRELFAQAGWPDYSATHLQVLGAAECLGPQHAAPELFEAVMWLAVQHPIKDALQLFSREIAPAGTSWAPGTTGSGGGRPTPSLSIRQCGFLVPKTCVQAQVWVQGDTITPTIPEGQELQPLAGVSAAELPVALPQADWVPVRLLDLAYARSGDKGNHSNIGVIARKPEYLPILRGQLTVEAVGQYLQHWVKGPVTRYEVPGIGGFNFLCEQALAGGGMASLRNDPLGKGMGQVVLSMTVRVPPGLRG